MSLEHEEIRQVAQAAAREAVHETLLRLGIDEHEEEVFTNTRADLRYVRRLRLASETAGKAGLWTIVTVIVTAVIGALWVGVTSVINGRIGG